MKESASYRQVWVGIWVAALAPAATLPALAAQRGSWGWLGVAVLLPAAPLYLRLLRRLGDGGLGAALRERGWLGRCLLALYYLWVMGLAALTAGGCVDRLGRTDFGEVPGWLAAVLLVAVAAYLIYRGWQPFLRAVQMFFLVLMVAVALFLALGAANLRLSNLRPQSWDEVARGLGGVWGALATVGVGALGGFIPHAPRRDGEWSARRWITLWLAAATGLCVLVIGALGAQFAARVPLPLFLTLQGIGFPGGFQRLEAAGTAAWVLADLTLIGMTALVGREIAGGAGRRGVWGAGGVLAAALVGGWFLPNRVVGGARDALLGVNIAMGIVLPALVALTKSGAESG